MVATNYTTADINAATLSNISSDTRSGLVTPINSSIAGVPTGGVGGVASNSVGGLVQAPIPAASGSVTKVINNIGTQVKATLAPVFNVITEVSKVLKFVTSTVAEFSRIAFAATTQSPLATAKQVRDLVCKAIDFVKTYKLGDLLAGFSFPPKLPPGLKNFTVKKFIQKLIRKIEKKIWDYVYGLYMKIINAIRAIIKKYMDLIDNLIKQLKDLFTCNPGDKK